MLDLNLLPSDVQDVIIQNVYYCIYPFAIREGEVISFYFPSIIHHQQTNEVFLTSGREPELEVEHLSRVRDMYDGDD